MESRFRIRPARSADVPALEELERLCFSDPWSADGIRQTIQLETAKAFIAQESDRIVGYVFARISGPEGEILDLAVRPDRRRRGIAAGLLGAVREALHAAGVREVYLEVRQSNQAALALYGAHGFRPVGVRTRYYRDPTEDALVLRAPLTDRGFPVL